MGAIDENGESWDCDGLYVADASTFPTASGSNPMITTLAMARLICHRVFFFIAFFVLHRLSLIAVHDLIARGERERELSCRGGSST